MIMNVLKPCFKVTYASFNIPQLALALLLIISFYDALGLPKKKQFAALRLNITR